MAVYVCRVGTPAGDIISRRVEAIAEDEARHRLQREGYYIFSVDREGGSLLALRPRFRVLKAEDFLHFNQQLAALVRAGLPILQAISMLARRQTNETVRTVLQDVEARIREGTPLSQAFAAQSEVFPRLYVAAVLAGEKSGNLDGVLLRYIAYSKQMVGLRRKVRAATTYPIFLLVALVTLVGIMTGFVIPRFSTIYQDFGGELPVITQIVMAVGNTVRANASWVVPGLLGTIAALVIWRRTARGRRAIDGFILKLPILSPIVRDVAVSQLGRSLATLLQGGITLVESFRIASESITNRVLVRSCGRVLQMIQEGESFAESLERAGWLPALAVDMVRVGERSGSLREMLDELANFYDAELEMKLNQVTTLIQPVMLVFMAGLVTFILLAMYLPLFNFISTLGAR